MQKMIALIVIMISMYTLPVFGFEHNARVPRKRSVPVESTEELFAAMVVPQEQKKILVVDQALTDHPYGKNVENLLRIARARGITAWVDGSDSKYMSHLLETELHLLATKRPRVFLALCSHMVSPVYSPTAREVLYKLTLNAMQREYTSAKAVSAKAEMAKKRLIKDNTDLENEIAERDRRYNLLQERKRS